MRILIAEDTRDLNKVLVAALEHSGYSIDSAFDGEEALALILKNGYDLLILDIMMPKKDGIEVLKEIRSKHITTPVMMLTAKAEVDDRVIGLDAGADDYLAKPFAMKELLARVRAVERRKSEYVKSAVSFGDLKLNAQTCEISCENSIVLCLNEFELLQALIQDSGNYIPSSYLLETVWRNEEATEDTLMLYILYLRNKLSAVSSGVEIDGDNEKGYCLVYINE